MVNVGAANQTAASGDDGLPLKQERTQEGLATSVPTLISSTKSSMTAIGFVSNGVGATPSRLHLGPN
jgi:hypothetical protein